MKNIFLLYIPPSNYEALVHYEDTIKKRVPSEDIYRYVDQTTKYKLSNVFGSRKIAVWGSRDSQANRSKFNKMQEGDDILIVEGDMIKLLGKIAAKIINPDLSKQLWKDLKGKTSTGWSLIYFIANPVEIQVPFKEFNKLFNYSSIFQPRGFSIVAEDKLRKFNERYDELYSILLKIKQGLPVQSKEEEIGIKDSTQEEESQYIPVQPEDVEEVLNSNIISDHVKMQWKLVNLGIKTGSKVWIPANDQKKIRELYHFENFEEDFSAGLDTQAKYVENIDVVWKEEFRIDAAFEIENTTSIYSGLLRFSDLTLVAPNTIYPLFIVSPIEKKNRLLEQLRRPTFKNLGIDKKVRFLPYETIDEIDRFFMDSTSGLSIELLEGKAENLLVS